jgi:predicted GNAT family acetyltransferase
LTVRRICKEDCRQKFRTGEKKFDFDSNNNLIGLTFYLDRDGKDGYQSYVYENEGEIIGILCVQLQQNALYLSRIGIKQEYRKKGNGYYLYKKVMELVQENKIKVIFVKAHDGVFSWFMDLGYHRIHVYEDPLWGKSADMFLLIG